MTFRPQDAPQPGHVDTRTVIEAFLAQVASRPDKPCLVFAETGDALGYAELELASRRAAGQLGAAGLRPGDVVFIVLPTGPGLYAAFIGAMMLGAIPAFMPGPSAKQEPGQYWRDHGALLARTRPRLLVTDQATAAAISASGLTALHATSVVVLDNTSSHQPIQAGAIVRPQPSDIAFLQHSSGTTGLKKGVMLSHRATVTQVDACSGALGSTADDVVATWLPVYHDMGLISSTVMPLMQGQTIVIIDPFRWSSRPILLLEAIERYRATLTWLPNFAFDHMVRTIHPDQPTPDLSGMRAFINCSEAGRAPTYARFLERFAKAGVRADQMHASYAMAETVFAITQTRPGEQPRTLKVAADALRLDGRARPPAPGEDVLEVVSTGRPLRGVSVQVLEPDGTVRDEREVGELVVRSTCLFDGYYRDPVLTAERITPDGLHTRDIGFVDGGEVFVLGRLDDLIIVHGRNYYAGEVEAAVNTVPGVRPGRAVAFAVDNPNVGSQDIVVVVEAISSATEGRALSKQIKQRVTQALGLGLREVLVVTPGWLSKTTSGKISRTHNQARYIAERQTRG